MSVDDPIAEKLLSDNPYDRLHVRQFSYFKQPIDQKLAWQSYLLFAIAALLPLLAFTPPPIRETYFPVVATATPRFVFVALVALAVVAGAGFGLALTEHVRLRARPLDERLAREILTFETLCSLVGFGTGGCALLAAYLFVLMGFGGTEVLDAFLAVGGGNPFVSSGFGVSVGIVATAALVCGVVLQTLSAYFHVRVALLDLTAE
jgi:hypothetical protein